MANYLYIEPQTDTDGRVSAATRYRLPSDMDVGELAASLSSMITSDGALSLIVELAGGKTGLATLNGRAVKHVLVAEE